MRIVRGVLAGLALLGAQVLHADPGQGVDRLLGMSLEDLMTAKVRISTNTERELSKAPSVVSIITAEDIRATGATNLVEILQSVPGIYIRENLFGYRPLVTFRGASSFHTLLMLNGIPMRDLVWASGMFWKGLPTNMIERVEIIRGPGSALYGSDASAGVINVITRTAGKMDGTEWGIRAGSFDSQSAWIQRGGEWNGFDLGFTGEVSRTAGHDPLVETDRQTATDRTYRTNASYAPGNAHYGWRGGDFHFSLAQGNWHLNADYMRHDQVQIGLTGAAVLDPMTKGDDGRFHLQLLYSNPGFAQHWALNGEARYTHLNYGSGSGFQERPPGYKDAGGLYPDGLINQQRVAQEGLTLEVNGLYTGFRQHSVKVGVGGNAERLTAAENFVNFGTGPDGRVLPAGGPVVDISGTPYAFIPVTGRRIRYLYLQDVWTLSPDWELTAGARYDHYSDFGSTVNPRLALVWQTGEKLTSKLMYGSAFRAPSYLELYSVTSASRPNPNLRPERTNTWDLAFDYRASAAWKFGVDFYLFDQSDVIGLDGGLKYQNIGNLRAKGVELEAQWQASKTWRVSASLSSRVENYSSLRNFNVPKRTAYLRSDWAAGAGWNVNVQATCVGPHLIPPTDTRPAPGGYALVDMTLRRAWNRDLELSASVRNLFNVQAVEYTSSVVSNNLLLPTRSLYFEFRHKI